jgi:protein arginine kinase activator
MICQLCGKTEGSHKVTVMDKGQYKELVVCKSCLETMEKQQFIDTFSMLMLPLLAMNEANRMSELKQRLDSLQSQNCPECYELFKTFMLPMIQSIHKSYHIPKIKRKRSKLEDVRHSLRKAISDERFEDAAKLRDELRQLESGIDTENHNENTTEGGANG